MLSCSVFAEGESSRQGRALALRGCVVQFAQFAEEYVGRPAVEDDVMRGEHQDMIFSGETDQARAEERPFDQVERC